jgi:glycosyltransferase involved in cell wall biosynthesis
MTRYSENNCCRVSVAICTFNGASRIESVLAALACQTLDAGDWEVLVVDNASTDGTAAVAIRSIREHLGGRGRVVHEERPGLSFARARAAQESQGEILCFLDDDNIPAPNWVEMAVQAFAARPRAGVVGGKVLARWETKPTPLAEAVAPFALAICDIGNDAVPLYGIGGGIVGAGLCVRRSVLREIFHATMTASQVTDRIGSNLISGGDLAISILARQAGWEIWYDPALVIEHCLPASRMEKSYLLRLYEGIGRGQAATRSLYDWKADSPLRRLLGLKDYVRWLRGKRLESSSRFRAKHGDLAGDLHELNQAMTLGRAMEALGK